MVNLIYVIAIVMSTFASLSQGGTIPEERLLQWLSSSRQDVKEAAVAYILREVPPQRRSAAVDEALAGELTRLNELVDIRREADRAGSPLDDAFPSEYHAQLIQAVSQSSRAVVIRPLAEAVGTGAVAENGLAKFGQQAIPVVTEVARRRVGTISFGAPRDTPPHVVGGALRVLQRIVERSARLSDSSRQELVAVATDRLRGRQEASVVIAACELAVALHDPALRARVEVVASDQGPEQLGISDPISRRQVREGAAKALGRVR